MTDQRPVNSLMKTPSLQDLLALIQNQSAQIERLETQVKALSSVREDRVNDNVTNDNQVVQKQENGPTDSRLQDLEDVVTDIKGEMMELMYVYQDVQDKLFDIDRLVNFLEKCITVFSIHRLT